MKLSNLQINLLKRNKIVVLATTSNKNHPHSIFVEVNIVTPSGILITDNQMKVTRRNIMDNGKVSILAFRPDYSRCLKISGTAKYEKEGTNFEKVKKLKTNIGYNPKGVLVIKIGKIEMFK